MGWTRVAVLILAFTIAHVGAAVAGPVTVRYAEGVTRAFPTLRSTDNEKLAQGDLTQVVRGDRVESRLVFRFRSKEASVRWPNGLDESGSPYPCFHDRARRCRGCRPRDRSLRGRRDASVSDPALDRQREARAGRSHASRTRRPSGVPTRVPLPI